MEENENTTVFVSTYKYVHPNLKGAIESFGIETPDTNTSNRTIGTFIDIYAFGVVTYKMFAGDENLPRPLSENSLSVKFRKQNIELSEAPDSFIIELSNLVLQMLKVRPGKDGITVEIVSKILSDLRRKAIETLPPMSEYSRVFISPSDSQQFGSITEAISESIGRLQSITEDLEEATIAMLRTPQKIEVPPDNNADSKVLSEMDLAFMNAKKRIGTSWSLAVGMTSLAFLLVATMIACAVVLTFVRAESSWGLVFGGASVPLVVGVLLWRPFDRIFRATILAQQIEMIHVRASTSYKMTSDFEKRIEICKDAIEGLQTVFREHAIPTKQESNTKDKLNSETGTLVKK